jgi:hypothetical protein
MVTIISPCSAAVIIGGTNSTQRDRKASATSQKVWSRYNSLSMEVTDTFVLGRPLRVRVPKPVPTVPNPLSHESDRPSWEPTNPKASIPGANTVHILGELWLPPLDDKPEYI